MLHAALIFIVPVTVTASNIYTASGCVHVPYEYHHHHHHLICTRILVASVRVLMTVLADPYESAYTTQHIVKMTKINFDVKSYVQHYRQ